MLVSVIFIGNRHDLAVQEITDVVTLCRSHMP